jgi:chromosome partitioning protein
MGKVITVMNMKGGVGKTTVAANLGGNLSCYLHEGRRRNVLLIDYDPQFNLSQAYISASEYTKIEKEGKTVLSVLLEDPTKLDPFHLKVSGNEKPPLVADVEHISYKQTASRGKLGIVPSTLNLMYVALGEPETKTKPIEERFRKFIEEARGLYDVVLIDCHPAGSIFTKTALRNSDHVLIPVVPERYSVRGVGLMLTFMEAQQQGNSGPEAHILFNRVPRNGISPEEHSIRSNPKYSSKCLTKTLKKFSAFAEPMEGRGFVWFSDKPYSGEARGNLYGVTGEIVTKLGL